MTIYFYKSWQPYGCFTNFSSHGITIERIHWPAAEHYYQAQKFLGTKDRYIIHAIHNAKTPEESAALGRCPDHKVRPDWESVKINIMRTVVLEKFNTHKDIREILLSTGKEILVENSPTDYFWGCGASKSPQNNLGKILMDIRSKLLKTSTLKVLAIS